MLNKEIRDNLKRDVPLLKNVYLKMWEKYTGTSHIVKTFRDRDWWIAIKNNVFNRLQNPVLKFPVIPGDESQTVELTNTTTDCLNNAFIYSTSSSIAWADQSNFRGIRTEKPLLPLFLEGRVGYFEITIQKMGDSKYINVGLTQREYPIIARAIGLYSETFSVGYHGEDGALHESNKICGQSYGPDWDEGGVIGCLLDFYDYSIWFTSNGSLLEKAVTLSEAAKHLVHMLYPTVATRSSGSVIKFNFGEDPFAFNLHNYLEEANITAHLRQAVQGSTIPLLSQAGLAPFIR